MKILNGDINNLQLKGKYKLPKNIATTNNKKWINLDFWFTVDQIKETKV